MSATWSGLTIGGDPEQTRCEQTANVRRLVTTRYHKHRRRTPDTLIASSSNPPGDPANLFDVSPAPSLALENVFPSMEINVPKEGRDFYVSQSKLLSIPYFTWLKFDTVIFRVGPAFNFSKGQNGRNDFLSMYVPLIKQDRSRMSLRCVLFRTVGRRTDIWTRRQEPSTLGTPRFTMTAQSHSCVNESKIGKKKMHVSRSDVLVIR
jgi:hypothetical protein